MHFRKSHIWPLLSKEQISIITTVFLSFLRKSVWRSGKLWPERKYSSPACYCLVDWSLIGHFTPLFCSQGKLKSTFMAFLLSVKLWIYMLLNQFYLKWLISSQHGNVIFKFLHLFIHLGFFFTAIYTYFNFLLYLFLYP